VSRAANLARGSVQLLGARPLTHILLSARRARRQLETLVAEHPPAVVVAYCSGMARFALEPPLDGLPYVLDLVDVDSAKWRALASTSSRVMRWIYRREARTLEDFERLAVARAAATLVVNDREGEALRRTGATGPILTMENGIDLEAFRPPEDTTRGPVVVFCGVMDYAPNESGVLWFLQEVWPFVVSIRPDAQFHIVGRNPTRVLYQAAARFPSVTITGAVPAVQPYLWKAAVSVAPLQLARGLQNKVLESLAAGLPVVTTAPALAGLPKAARAGCMSVGDPADFARAVLTLLDDAHLRRAKTGAVVFAGLSWPDRLQGLERILRGAAGLATTRVDSATGASTPHAIRMA
jgi:sugar transferase (PEP-CTERM/EpsH1 system associated)